MMSEIHEQLGRLAYDQSKPFCYGCYEEAPKGRCKSCGSDDLLRLIPGVGCEWGTDWVVKHILEIQLDPIDLEIAFEEPIRDTNLLL